MLGIGVSLEALRMRGRRSSQGDDKAFAGKGRSAGFGVADVVGGIIVAELSRRRAWWRTGTAAEQLVLRSWCCEAGARILLQLQLMVLLVA